MFYVLLIVLSLVLPGTADAAFKLKDEGTDVGVVWNVDCTGSGITCSKSGASGTINVTGGGGGGSGDVTKVGTPVDNEVGVWTGDGTLEGDTNYTWDGTQLNVNGNIEVAQGSTSAGLASINNRNYDAFGLNFHGNNKLQIGQWTTRAMGMGLSGATFYHTLPSDGQIGFASSTTVGSTGGLPETVIKRVAANTLGVDALEVETPSSSTVGLKVKGAASQTSNILELEDSSSNLMTYFDEDGALVINENAQSINPLRVETSSQPYAFYIGSAGRIGINTNSLSSDLNLGGTGIISAFGSANQLRNFDTLQTGTSGANRLNLNAGEIYMGGGVGSAKVSIKAHNTSVAPLGLQQISGGSEKMITIKDDSGVETMGVTTSGFTQAGAGNGLARYDIQHTVSPSSADGDGVGFALRTENASGTLLDVAYIDAIYTDISQDDVDLIFSVRNSATPAERLKLNADGTATFNQAYSLPSVDGTSGQQLQTNGSGTVTWETPSGGGGSPAGSDGQIQYNNGGAFGGALHIDDTNDRLGVGSTSPAAKIESQDTTDDQLRLAYDASNYISFRNNSAGSNYWYTTGPNIEMETSGSKVLTLNNGTNSVALALSGDRLFHDTDNDGTKDAGEEFIDLSGGGASVMNFGFGYHTTHTANTLYTRPWGGQLVHGNTADRGVPMTSAGSITKMRVLMDVNAWTGGSISVSVTKNGTSNLSCTFSTPTVANGLTCDASASSGTHTFVAGDVIGVVRSLIGATATTDEITVNVEVEYS